MILNINEAISKETIDKVIDAFNRLKPSEKLFLYFSSEGGDINSAEAIIHIINNNVDLVEIVGYGELNSAAFMIFFKTNCYKILLPGAVGMFHQIVIEGGDINQFNNADEARYKADKEWLKLQKEHTINFCTNLNMTDREIYFIKKGKDVYFQYNRMQEFLKSQEK